MPSRTTCPSTTDSRRKRHEGEGVVPCKPHATPLVSMKTTWSRCAQALAKTKQKNRRSLLGFSKIVATVKCSNACPIVQARTRWHTTRESENQCYSNRCTSKTIGRTTTICRALTRTRTRCLASASHQSRAIRKLRNKRPISRLLKRAKARQSRQPTGMTLTRSLSSVLILTLRRLTVTVKANTEVWSRKTALMTER